MLKGYLDRVLMIPQFAFATNAEGTSYQGGLLRHQKALVIQTLGSSLGSGFRYGTVADYCRELTASLYYAGLRQVDVLQFWNLYQLEAPDAQAVLQQVFQAGRTSMRQRAAARKCSPLWPKELWEESTDSSHLQTQS
jgi:putative NADPH-quinone reductase